MNENIINLKLGKMSTKEIAEWFGIKESSYRKNKNRKLEELATHADYREIYGGVIIDNIKIPVYQKQSIKNKAKLEEVFLQEWDNEEHNNLNTCANVARKICDKYGTELSGWELGTINEYARQIRKRDFGIPCFEDGALGSCNYLWAKAIPAKGQPGIYICEKLTEEENKIKDELLKKYFSTKNAGDIEKKIIIDEMVKSGEITKDMAYDLYKNVDGLNEIKFQQYLLDLKRLIGYKVIKTTELFIGRYLQAEKREAALIIKEGEFNFGED